MNYNGINFNKEHWAGKTLEQFIAHEGHHGLTQKQLREAHQLMQPAAAEKKPAQKKPDELS